MIFKIWVAADCLPKVVNSIVRSIDKLLSTYWQYRSGRGRQSGRKERTSDLPVAQSIRRSRRLNRDTTVRDQETLTPGDQSSQAAEEYPSDDANSPSAIILRLKWIHLPMQLHHL